MIIQISKTNNIKDFETILDELSQNKDVNGILILSADENNYDNKKIDEIIKKIKTPIFGGIFPEIIYQNQKLKKGVIVAGITETPDITIINKLSNENIDYEEIIKEKISSFDDTKTMFVLVDGLSKRISALIESLFNLFGIEVNYIGGGAGSLSFIQKPCLFSNEGLLMDAALLVSTKITSGIGVNHGWSKIDGPFTVTESEKNIIKTIDWKPAFELYKEVVEKHSKKTFTDDNFFDISKSYPFGIAKHGVENIVRDPLMVGENNSLICVGEVPEESIIEILSGDTTSLIKAAKKASEIATKNISSNFEINTTLFIDCISRVLFLEDDFKKELDAVYDPKNQLIGALTLGEIANSGKDYVEFYNKTAVVGVLDN